jgi:hypothetical protein
MGPFLSILLLMVLGFANSFQSMSSALAMEGSTDERFIPNTWAGIKYSFMVSLADWGDIDFFDDWTFGIFVIASLLEVIVMLNVLIAIVSNAFQRVADNEVIYTYRERCVMINEWQFALGRLYFWGESRSSSEMLFFAVHDEDVESDTWFP